MAATTTTAAGGMTATERRAAIGTAARYAALIALGVLYTIPFAWMISLSVKPFSDLNTIPPNFIPSHFAWDNYSTALFQPMLYFPAFFVNTIYYVVLSGAGAVLSSAIVAYGFARIQFRGSNVLFTL